MTPKLIILDMDGTLYDIDDVVSQNYKMQVDFLSQYLNKEESETINILSEHDIYPTISEKSKSATEFFLSIGINKSDWSTYRESHYDIHKIDKSKAIDENTILEFSNIAKIVLLSSNSYNGIRETLSYLNINISLFTEIVCSNNFDNGKPFNKQNAMQYLCLKYSIPYQDMLSIGDRFQTDVAPLLSLGGQGIIVRKPKDLVQVLSDLKEDRLKTKITYQYHTQL